MKMNYRIIKHSLLLITLGVMIVSCFAPRYTWQYWLPDKSNATVNIGGYEAILGVSAPKEQAKYYKDISPGNIRYSLFFDTYYRGDLADSGKAHNIPIIYIDSSYINLPPQEEIRHLNLGQHHEYTSDITSIVKHGDAWIGPYFSTVIDIKKDQKQIIIGFRISTLDRSSKNVLESKTYKFYLTQFYDRYWILME